MDKQASEDHAESGELKVQQARQALRVLSEPSESQALVDLKVFRVQLDHKVLKVPEDPPDQWGKLERQDQLVKGVREVTEVPEAKQDLLDHTALPALRALVVKVEKEDPWDRKVVPDNRVQMVPMESRETWGLREKPVTTARKVSLVSVEPLAQWELWERPVPEVNVDPLVKMAPKVPLVTAEKRVPSARPVQLASLVLLATLVQWVLVVLQAQSDLLDLAVSLVRVDLQENVVMMVQSGHKVPKVVLDIRVFQVAVDLLETKDFRASKENKARWVRWDLLAPQVLLVKLERRV